MKKAIICLAIFFQSISSIAIAQEQGKFRVGLDLGYATTASGGGGFMFYLEPKYNIQDNMNIGLRIGGTSILRDVVRFSNSDDFIGTIIINSSITLTYDYYFKTEESNFAPFVGAGLGWVRFASMELDSSIDQVDYGEFSHKYSLAPVLRAGFEAAKFRLSLEYNFIPKSDLVDTRGNIIGETSNSYLGIAIGFYVGGGKWRN